MGLMFAVLAVSAVAGILIYSYGNRTDTTGSANSPAVTAAPAPVPEQTTGQTAPRAQ